MEHDKVVDVAIVGAGAAGVSCAVWLARLGFTPVLLDASDQVGGLCRGHSFVDNWNASLPGMTGPQVADNLAKSLDDAAVDTRLSHRVRGVHRDGAGWRLTFGNRAMSLRCRYVVLATGVRARSLPPPSAPRELPTGVLIGPGDAIVRQCFQGKRVAVLGGGDNAFENALYAQNHGARAVQIFARRIRAQHQFVEQLCSGQVTLGEADVDINQRLVNGQQWDLILVFYGWEARLPDCYPDELQVSARGFVATDTLTAQTSVDGVYAIGELAQRMHPCVVTALADGVTAAKAIQARIEASSAGG